MSAAPTFEQSVFINCPFDADFSNLLQAIAFCVVDLGFVPRIAPENANNAANRLERILELIRSSKFGIHDLIRSKSITVGEFARMNMPFELGLDHACAVFGAAPLDQKSILILEENRYDYQKCISDISGWDIQAHSANYINLIRIVRDWLVQHAGAPAVGSQAIRNDYVAFQEWYWERERHRGASDDDIRAYPTIQVINAMREWFTAGKPATF
jgi:hypothetical protein